MSSLSESHKSPGGSFLEKGSSTYVEMLFICPGKIHRKITIGIVVIRVCKVGCTEWLSVGEGRGSEGNKVEKKWDLFYAQFCPLSPCEPALPFGCPLSQLVGKEVTHVPWATVLPYSRTGKFSHCLLYCNHKCKWDCVCVCVCVL